jgi:hypothetical protein
MAAGPARDIRRVLLCSAAAAGALWVIGQPANAQFVPGDLLVSESTYQDTGAASGLVANVSQLPGANAGQTVTAVAGGAYTQVWQNAPVDGSFGVTSEITINQITPGGSPVSSISIPTNQVLTSFSSKSELGLTLSSSGQSVSFMGYSTQAGLGALDISNSDTPGHPDPTNPVTSFFGSGYGAARTIVSINASGAITYTPTTEYGGNNGRNALLAPNGLYYTAGNGNNGTTGTSPPGDFITTHVGIGVVSPVNATTATGTTPVDSTQINNQFISVSGDKFGKDSNFRGITLNPFDGQLYFTKGSGSNGVDTVYTATNPGGVLPTAGTAQQSTVSIAPGFPTTPVKQTAGKAGDFTPFGLFFANGETMYVADEGSGNATDTGTYAGLDKFSLVNGSWRFDYRLTAGLNMGLPYTLTDPNGQNPYVVSGGVTGLRDLFCTDNTDGTTVTCYAATATNSNSGDNGADPNALVAISDVIGDTLASQVSGEQFHTLIAPEYGTVIRGVSETPVPEPLSLAVFGVALGGLRLVRRRAHA